MSLALLAFATAWDLADIAAAEKDPRKRAKAVRTANAMMALGRRLEAAPVDDPDAWDAWREEGATKAEGRAAARRKAIEELEAELAEARAEAARRDVEDLEAWTGDET